MVAREGLAAASADYEGCVFEVVGCEYFIWVSFPKVIVQVSIVAMAGRAAKGWFCARWRHGWEGCIEEVGVRIQAVSLSR